MTATLPLIRRQPFVHLVSSLDDMGVNIAPKLSRYGIHEWQYGAAEDLIPLIDFIKVFGAASNLTGTDLVGKMVADRLKIFELAEFGRTIESSFTVFDSMKVACDLIPKEVTTLRFWLTQTPYGYLFCRKQLYSTPDIDHSLYVLEQYTLSLLTQIIRLGAGEKWQPPALHMSIASGGISTNWAEKDDIRVKFETPFSAIFVPNSVLSLPLNRCSAHRSTNVAGQRLHVSAVDRDLVLATRELLSSFIRLGERDLITLENIAEIAGLSTRTLQRRLTRENQSFLKLWDQARFGVAMEMIDDPDIRIADLSEAVGYENPQHFIRAFRRWAGMTPGQYRKDRAKHN